MAFSVLNSYAAWRTTIQNLQQDFRESAERFPNLQHAILQALDNEGTIPPSFQREMRKAGGWSEGELRARWEQTETVVDSRQSSYLDWLALNRPAKRSYLFGERAGRERFEALANQAWLALPGTVDGKAQAYPQLRMVDRWVAFVYGQLQTVPSYLAVDEELWVLDYSKQGRRIERRFAPRAIRNGELISTGYPEAETIGLSRRAKRWIHTRLATDPFTASTPAIDIILAHPDKEGPYLMSNAEMDTICNSPSQKSNFLVDYLMLGSRRKFPIYRDWCKPVPGSTPSVCPNSNPPESEADRKGLLSCLPAIAERFRELNLIKKGETIHWVGGQASLGTLCTCNLSVVGKMLVSAGKPPMTSDQRLVSELLPKPPDPFAEPRRLARDMGIVSRGIVELICDRGGSIPLDELAAVFNWSDRGRNFQSNKERIMKKLKPRWSLFRKSNVVRLENIG